MSGLVSAIYFTLVQPSNRHPAAAPLAESALAMIDA